MVALHILSYFLPFQSDPRRQQNAQRLGLQSRHAYTITKVVEIRAHKVRGGIPLIRLRNPHGNAKEWKVIHL